MWGRRKKGSGGSPIHFLCSRIYNFWGSLISGDEQQRPVNEATIGIRRASAWQDYILGYARRISYCCFVNRPLLFITTNQRSPKVVDSAAQKMYWRSTRPFFSPPPHKKKKSGLGTRLHIRYDLNLQEKLEIYFNRTVKIWIL